MIKVSIMYHKGDGDTFDMDHYIDKHMPMTISMAKAHPGFRGVSVEEGISGVQPGSQPQYVAICNIMFDTVENFWAATLPHSDKLQDDMLTCTNITPTIQISEVRINQ